MASSSVRALTWRQQTNFGLKDGSLKNESAWVNAVRCLLIRHVMLCDTRIKPDTVLWLMAAGSTALFGMKEGSNKLIDRGLCKIFMAGLPVCELGINSELHSWGEVCTGLLESKVAREQLNVAWVGLVGQPLLRDS